MSFGPIEKIVLWQTSSCYHVKKKRMRDTTCRPDLDKHFTDKLYVNIIQSHSYVVINYSSLDFKTDIVIMCQVSVHSYTDLDYYCKIYY